MTDCAKVAPRTAEERGASSLRFISAKRIMGRSGGGSDGSTVVIV